MKTTRCSRVFLYYVRLIKNVGCFFWPSSWIDVAIKECTVSGIQSENWISCLEWRVLLFCLMLNLLRRKPMVLLHHRMVKWADDYRVNYITLLSSYLALYWRLSHARRSNIPPVVSYSVPISVWSGLPSVLCAMSVYVYPWYYQVGR